MGASFTIGTTAATAASRLCGRFFNTINDASGPSVSVCTQTRPFRITFKTDSTEATDMNVIEVADMNEQNGIPGGIVGFSLNYIQQSC